MNDSIRAFPTVESLRADPRVLEAEQRLKAGGLTEARWNDLLEHVADLPFHHERVTHETRTEVATRRQKLAARMRETAEAIESDPEVRWYTPWHDGTNPVALTQVMSPQGGTLRLLHEHQKIRGLINELINDGPEASLRLYQWLKVFADVLECQNPALQDPLVPAVETRRGIGLRSYMVKGVHDLIEQFSSRARGGAPVKKARSRNVETALLASAMLDEDITANEVTQIRRKNRRRYLPRE